MEFFKKKTVKRVEGGAWGHLVNEHKVDVDTLYNKMRCVERDGFMENNKVPVKWLRVFRLAEAEAKGVTVTGWETFDKHPDLIVFEGYLTRTNQARLERKRE